MFIILYQMVNLLKPKTLPMQPTLIAVRSDNKRVIYEYKGEVGKTILQANIEGINGNKYYTHKGIVCFLPKVFQGKAPILSIF